MNTLIESVSTVFKPESAFAVAVQGVDLQPAPAYDRTYRSRSQLLREEFEWPGVPESPLHD